MKKESFVAFPIWLGTRFTDAKDCSAFHVAFSARKFTSDNYLAFCNVYAEKIWGEWPIISMSKRKSDIKQILSEIAESLVIFFVVTPPVAELPWLDEFIKNLKRYRSVHQKKEVFCYKIIMGGDIFSKLPKHEDEAKYWREERRSLELGGIFSYLDTDAPSNGCERMVELMNRIMGMDLQSEKFPDYSLEELGKIAWNINRENFNYFGKRTSSIPKYSIIDGKPQFSF